MASGSGDLHSKQNQRKSKQKQWLKSRKADGLVIKGLQRTVNSLMQGCSFLLCVYTEP